MTTMPPHNLHTPHPSQKMPDPTKSSKSWAIALVTSALFLLAAAAVVAWIVISRSTSPQNMALPVPTDDAKNVKNVSFVAPADLHASYSKTDQSIIGETTILYFDDTTNCGIITVVVPVAAGKDLKTTAAEAINSLTPNITTSKSTDGKVVPLKDADDSAKTYDFSTLQLEQTISTPGVSYTGIQTVIFYKQFGGQAAVIAHTCKNETWPGKSTELSTVASAFTVKTER